MSTTATANMAYTPWVHALVQNGGDMEVTVAIFDKATGTNDAGEPIPGMDAKYTLTRWDDEHGKKVLFEERVFKRDEADEVTDYTCQPWTRASEAGSSCPDAGDGCEDCDEDGAPECPGFCGVAYRYKIIDHCPPTEDSMLYWMSVTPEYHISTETKENLSFTTGHFDFDEAGGVCGEKGCAVTHVGSRRVTLMETIRALMAGVL